MSAGGGLTAAQLRDALGKGKRAIATAVAHLRKSKGELEKQRDYYARAKRFVRELPGDTDANKARKDEEQAHLEALERDIKAAEQQVEEAEDAMQVTMALAQLARSCRALRRCRTFPSITSWFACDD